MNDNNEPPKEAESNESIYASLYGEYLKPIYSYLWKRVGRSREVAEELAQETFLRVWKQLPRLAKGSVVLPAYLFRTAKNLLVSYYRKKKPITLPTEELPDVAVGGPAEIEAALDLETVWEKLGILSAAEREAVLLRYREDMEIAHVAKTLNRSENATKLLLTRARKKLRKQM